MSKHVLIVAFGQTHGSKAAEAIGRETSPIVWSLVTTAKDLISQTLGTCDLVFTETARHLPDYDRIVEVARDRGFEVPTPIHEWGYHAATLSGAFKLMEGVHGERHLSEYDMRARGGCIAVRHEGSLIMSVYPGGKLRIAIKGACL